MGFSTAETIGFAESLLTFIRSNKAALEAAGLKVDNWILELENQKTTALKINDEQELLKVKLREKTDESIRALDILYDNASTKLDAVSGALGKKTEISKQILKLRSSMNNKSRKPKSSS
jgi:hypothetical protein